MADVETGVNFTNPTNVFLNKPVVDDVETDTNVSLDVGVETGDSFSDQETVEIVSEEDQKLIDEEEISTATEEVLQNDNLLTFNPVSKKLLEAKITQDRETTKNIFTDSENNISHQKQVEMFKKNWSTRYGINTIEERDFFLNKEKEKLGDNFKEDNYLPYTMEELVNQDTKVNQGNSDKRIATIERYLKSPNYITSGLTEQLLKSDLTIGEINSIVLGDTIINPVTALADSPYHFGLFQERLKEGKFAAAAGYFALTVLDIAQANIVVRGLSKGIRAIRLSTVGSSTGKVTRLESENIAAIHRSNAEIAYKNSDDKDTLIREFETKTNSKISKLNADGHLVIDNNISRVASRKKIDEIYDEFGDLTQRKDIDKLNVDLSDSDLLLPILNPAKLDGLVALVSKLKKQTMINADGKEVLKFPNLSKKGGDRKPLVDELLDMTVDKDLLGDVKIYDMLAEHNLSFEDYILTILGSASDAGKLLNKLSQIKRGKMRNFDEIEHLDQLKIDKTENSIKKFWKYTFVRGEGIFRGMMVSSLATAARNAIGGGIRMPLESLSNVMDAALYTYATKGLKSSVGTVIPFTKGSAWKDSFRSMRLLASPEYAKEYTDFFLNRPEFAENFSKMFDNVNEVRKFRGRGKFESRTGIAYDKAMGSAEDFVQMLNGPNQLQEFLIRRATFLGALERRVKLEWDIDLIDGLNTGKFTMQDLMGDVSTLRKAGADDFKTIMDDAVRTALDVTYAKTPEWRPFRWATSVITESGLTVVIPFPRFMFNSMEFVAEHSAGALLPALRRATGNAKGPLTKSERRMVSRNMMGLTSLVGLMMYRNSEDAPADYKMVAKDEFMDLTDPDKTLIDTTTLFPVRQALWIVEAVERSNALSGIATGSRDEVAGTRDMWSGWSKKEVLDVFGGGGIRTGVANVWVKGVTDIIDGIGDEPDSAKWAKVFGDAFGQWQNRILTPTFQLIEGQRATVLDRYGPDEKLMRPLEYKEFRGKVEDDLSMPFWNQVMEAKATQGKRRGLSAPSSERDRVDQQNIFVNPSDGARIEVKEKLFFGLNQRPLPTEDNEFLIKLGYQNADYELASRKSDPKGREYENREIRKIIPLAIDQAIVAREKLKDELLSRGQKVGTEFNRKLVIRADEVFRSFVKKHMESAKVKKAITGRISPLSAAVTKYSRLPRKKRNAAKLRFEEVNPNEEIDFSNLSHLKMLIAFGNVYN
tara:strand:- start:53 stop:3691 length:3639 start_codon:yes stop_codon:yes gene_type:complete